MEDNNRYMTVFDDKNNPVEMYILFTTSLDEYEGKKYIFFTDPKDEDGQVFVATISDDGTLNEVTDEKEWEKLDEVFEDYMKNSESSGCQGCSGNCQEGNCDQNCSCN